jgi:RNAse (barnase) inhibitor barstar
MTMHCSTYIPDLLWNCSFNRFIQITFRNLSLIQNLLKIFYSDIIDPNETKFDWNSLWDVLFQNFVLQPCRIGWKNNFTVNPEYMLNNALSCSHCFNFSSFDLIWINGLLAVFKKNKPYLHNQYNSVKKT